MIIMSLGDKSRRGCEDLLYRIRCIRPAKITVVYTHRLVLSGTAYKKKHPFWCCINAPSPVMHKCIHAGGL